MWIVTGSTACLFATWRRGQKCITTILGLHPGGTPALNTASNPASAGDALEIYCTGLGPVSPSVIAGTPASSTTLSYTGNTVTATVGGKNAQVLFAGLAPGYVGLYQVNVTVPAGIRP